MRYFNVVSALNVGEKSDVLKEAVKTFGQAEISINANPLNGNLFVKDHMFTYVDRGISLNVGMVYNSQSENPWRLNLGKQINEVQNANQIGSRLELIEEDSNRAIFEYDPSAGCYIETGPGNEARRFTKEGDGWSCFNPTTGQQDHYDASLKIQKTFHPDGTNIDYHYDDQGRIDKLLTNVDQDGKASQCLEMIYTDNSLQLFQVNDKQRASLATYHFDDERRLTKTQIPLSESESYETNYHYDDKSGLLSKVDQSDTTCASFQFYQTPEGSKLARICDGENHLYRFGYKPPLSSLTDPLNNTVNYQANHQGLLQNKSDGLHNVNYFYDTNGRVEKTIYQDNTFDFYTYDQLGLCSSVTDRNGDVTKFNHDQKTGLLLSKTKACREDDSKSATTYYVYNDKRQLCYEVSPVGCVTKYTYDEAGNRASRRIYKESLAVVAQRVTNNYLSIDEMQEWEKSEDKLKVALTEWQCTKRGQVEREVVYATINASGAGVLDELASVNVYRWDERGRCIETNRRLDKDTNAVESKQYDGLSRLTYKRDAIGGETKHLYEGGSHTIQHIATGLDEIIKCDKAGNIEEIIACADSQIRTDRNIYDAAGRCAIIVRHDGTKHYIVYDVFNRKQFEIDAARQVTEYKYDSNDNIVEEITYAEPISSIDENNLLIGKWQPAPVRDKFKLSKTQKQYDAENRLKVSVDAEGYVTEYKYDSLGNLADKIQYAKKAIDAMGGYSKELITPNEDDRHYRYFYYKDGSLQAEQGAAGHVIAYKRNKAGDLMEETRFAIPQNLLDKYDINQIEKSKLDSIDQYKRDAKGQRYEHVDAENYTTLNTHDAGGRVIAKLRGGHEAKYGYDALDRVVNESDQSGLEVKRSFHANGKLAFEEKNDKNKADNARQLLQQYDGFAQLTQIATDKKTILNLQSAVHPKDESILKHSLVLNSLRLPAGSVENTGLWSRLNHYLVENSNAIELESAKSLLVKMASFKDVMKSTTSAASVTEAISYAKTYCALLRVIILKDHWRTYLGGKWRVGRKEDDLLPEDLHVLPDGHFEVEKIIQQIAEMGQVNDYSGLETIKDCLGQIRDVFKREYDKRGFWDHEKTIDFYKTNMDFLQEALSKVREPLLDDHQAAEKTDIIAEQRFYSTDGLCVASCDAQGNYTYYYYDELRRPVVTIDPLGAIIEKEYEAYGDTVKSERLYHNHISAYALAGITGGFVNEDVRILLSETHSEKNEIRQEEHDKRGLPLFKTDGEGFREGFKHNAFGELEEHEIEVEKNKTLSLTTFKHDKKGRVTEKVSDARGKQVKEINQYNDESGEIVHTDGEGNVTKSYYDRLSRLVRQLDALGSESRTEWDEQSRIKKEINALKQETNYRWSPDGRTVRKETMAGAITTEMNAFGELAKVTQEAGGQAIEIVKHYDDQGRIVELVEPHGTTSFIYDINGRVEFELSPSEVMTKYVRNAAGQVEEKIVDSNGLKIRTQYRRDSQGRIEAQCDGEGVWTRYEYNKRGDEVESIVDLDGLNIITHKEYNGLHQLAEKKIGDKTNNDQYQQTFDNDSLGRCTAEHIDPAGLNITTASSYDNIGNVKTITDPNGKISWLFHDALSRERFRITPDSVVHEKQYDAIGNCIYERTYSKLTQLADIQTLNLKQVEESVAAIACDQDSITHYIYDKHDKPKYKVRLFNEEDKATQGIVEEFTYDAAGREIAHTKYAMPIFLDATATVLQAIQSQQSTLLASDKNRTIYRYYDTASQERYTIDQSGRVIERRFNANGKEIARIQYADKIDSSSLTEHSKLSDIVAIIKPVSADRIKYKVYDNLGRKTFSVSPRGYVKSYQYDNNNKRLEKCVFKDPIVVPATYEELENFVTTMVPDKGKDSITKVEYDKAGRIYKTKDALGKEDIFKRDALGSVREHTDRNGNVWANEFDRAKRLIREISPETTIEVIKKDQTGKLFHSELKTKVTRKTDYDNAGNALSITEADGIDQLTDKAESPRIFKLDYDGANRVTATQVPNAVVAKKSSDKIETELTNIDQKILYNSKGKKIASRDAEAVWDFYIYDSVGRLIYEIKKQKAKSSNQVYL